MPGRAGRGKRYRRPQATADPGAEDAEARATAGPGTDGTSVRKGRTAPTPGCRPRGVAVMSVTTLRRAARDCGLVLLGALGGFAVSRWLQERPPRRDGAGPGPWARAWDEAVEGAAAGLESARHLVRPHAEPDVQDLEERLAMIGGAEGCRIRALGPGIVEVVGSAEDEATLQAVLDTVAGEPGVDVVVNRVWTPSSSAPGGTPAS